jgi:parallel beta-helix repeat protein
MAEPIRSNGTGGGPWSAPATWEGGKVPTNGSVTILGKDIVDLDSSAAKSIECDELVIDPQGMLRVTGQNKTSLRITIHKAIRVFGGMIVDFSKDPESKCEFVWETPEEGKPELQLNDGSRVLWKGAEGDASPNVAFRMPIPKTAPKPAKARPVTLLIASRVWVECERVAMDGFDVYVNGVDGTGLKYNEACAFRNCAFNRSSAAFRLCTKIEFEGNVMQGAPAFGVTLASTSHSRIVSNVIERTSGPSGALIVTGCSDCEIIGNTVRRSVYGISITSSSDLFLIGNRIEENRIGLQLNSCTRITSQRCMFSRNEVMHVRAIYSRPGEPWRFYDCVFENPPTKPGAVSISVEGIVAAEIVNSPLQTYATTGKRGPLTFSAYLDVLVTNEQGEPLGRVPIRVLSGNKAIATSRTESVGPMTGHTPLPSSHRPMVVPWHRFAPAEGSAKPTESITYQLEVDGTTLGYAKQVVPLTMDASFVRADPDKPTKTITVKLVKGK